MAEFEEYAGFYDIINSQKDYESEVAHVVELIGRYGQFSKSILEFGCGTGRHGTLLAEAGFDVVGVDDSEDMLRRAVPSERFSVCQGDVKNICLEKKFDAVISLFHVASYMTTNSDLRDFLANANQHLVDEGILIFDFWYGPAVISQGVSNRIVRAEDTDYSVFRVSEAALENESNTALIKFEIFIKEKSTGIMRSVTEDHRMRYFTLPELEWYLQDAGFRVVHGREFLSEEEPSLETWGMCVVCQKVGNSQ